MIRLVEREQDQRRLLALCEKTAFGCKIASWATAHVGAVANAELMNGDVAGTFRPTGTLTRAELASILMNANIHGFID